MKRKSIISHVKLMALACIAAVSFQSADAQGQSPRLPRNDYHFGADLSFLKQSEDNGFQYKENGVVRPAMDIFADHGYNWIRLRLFHTPTNRPDLGLPNDLEYTIKTAQEAKARGMKFLLNYHYADSWADPQQQYPPKAWDGQTHDQLVQTVFDYTLETMIAFREAGVYPDMVQVGNEISNGMLWPDGQLPENWDNFAELLRAGINGVYASCTEDLPAPQIMIHIDRAGDRNFTKQWFDKLHSYNIKYDVIGQSYYPWWHGTLMDLRANLYFMADTYKKDIIIVEVGYSMTPGRRYTEEGELPPYPQSPEGQVEFLQSVHEAVMATPDNRGLGIFWFEPASRRGGGSNFFDTEGNTQPVMTVFDKYTRQ